MNPKKLNLQELKKMVHGVIFSENEEPAKFQTKYGIIRAPFKPIEEEYNAERSGMYLTLKPVENGLYIHLTDEGKNKVAEDGISEAQFDDYFEDIRANSEYLYFMDGGEAGFGLTNAPVIAEGYFYSDNGELEFGKGADAYYYDNYMIDDFTQKLAEEGSVFFNKIPSSSEEESLQEANFDVEGGLTFDTLPTKVKEYFYKNITISVAFVKKDTTPPEVRHMAFRRNLKAYEKSTAEKTEAQANVLQNNNLMRIYDTNVYIKAKRELGDDPEANKKAAGKSYRSFVLQNVLAFLCGGEFFDMRETNKIKERFGDEVYDQLTANMRMAMEKDAAMGETTEEEGIVAESVLRKLVRNTLNKK